MSLMAEFPGPEPLVAAARAFGGRARDAFTPYPVEGLPAALGLRPSRLPWVMLAGGVAGAAACYGLILWSVLVDYPINVGGRPLHAWPAFAVLAFEAGVLGAALAGFLGLMKANGLPAYHHPAFEHLDFSRGGGFWLWVEDGAAEELRRLGATRIEEAGP